MDALIFIGIIILIIMYFRARRKNFNKIRRVLRVNAMGTDSFQRIVNSGQNPLIVHHVMSNNIDFAISMMSGDEKLACINLYDSLPYSVKREITILNGDNPDDA